MMHLLFSSDNNYAIQLCVVITSILNNKNKDDRLFFHIIDGGISKKNKDIISNYCKKYDADMEFLNIDSSIFEQYSVYGGLSLATYYRLIASSLFPKLDKILYLDSDIIVRGSLKEFYDLNIDNYYFVGVEDVLREKNIKRIEIISKYCNAGVLLLNLKLWRKEKIESKFFEYADKYKYNEKMMRYNDQDILNVVCQNAISYINPKFNLQVSELSMSKRMNNIALNESDGILHFFSPKKPWKNWTNHPFEKEYYKYLKMSPYSGLYYQRILHIIERIVYPQKILESIFAIKKINGIKTLIIFGIKIKLKKNKTLKGAK